MTDAPEPSRYQWSKLSGLQLGRYAEHWAKLRLIEAGYEVYSTEVDDRGIDLLVRIGAGRCLEIQVKAVRNRNLTFIQKKHLGGSPAEIERRLRSGYCMVFMLFEDGVEPEVYLIPGYAWLTPNAGIYDNAAGDRQYGPCLEIRSAKKNQPYLEPYRLDDQSVSVIVEEIKSELEGVTS